MISQQQKEQIRQAMIAYLAEQDISERRFADTVKVNGAYINAIKQGTYDAFPSGGKTVTIKDTYFEKVASFIRFNIEKTYWKHLDTDNYRQVWKACNKAKRNKARVGIDGFTGSGKTHALEAYKRNNVAETFVIKCSGDMNPKDFMLAIAEAVNCDKQGSRYHIRKSIVNKLLDMHRPVLIIDEAENVKKEPVLDAIKGMCDELENKCGIVLCGVDIRSKFQRLAEKRKYCYPQINRRFNGSWYGMFDLTESDIKQACTQMGIDSTGAITWLIKNVKDYGHLEHVISEALKESESSGNPVTGELLRILNS